MERTVQILSKINVAEADHLEEQMKEVLIAQLDDFEHSMAQLKKKREILVDTSMAVNRQANHMKINAEV